MNRNNLDIFDKDWNDDVKTALIQNNLEWVVDLKESNDRQKKIKCQQINAGK